jgi:DNA polymerase delta subunit 2
MVSRYDGQQLRNYNDMLTAVQLGGEKAQFVERVLDVRQGELCWVVGTVYMEMSLKPNVLDDISKEVRCSTLLPTI